MSFPHWPSGLPVVQTGTMSFSPKASGGLCGGLVEVSVFADTPFQVLFSYADPVSWNVDLS